ncbi:MAG: rhomboid family intramembrane serine protease [Solirubrobacterales bacterium]|nr:rhomboid family intramembrane serine protease [Solirubrobacterales bacterium]MBV9839737.1 rhomboid family intramembrane serine protease [Solirubrobacterales bacterium]
MSTVPERKRQTQIEGIQLLAGIVALMWIVEVINSLDANKLDNDGIYPRNLGRLWGILTAPFLHAGFGHLIANTVPFVFMGLIIALRGAARLAAVTLIVILVGGLGTWLIAPSHLANGQPVVTVGASGVVFGYAAYLLVRGLFDRSALELLIGAVVGVVWGGALLASLVPHSGISWQGHLCGAIGGVVAAWLLTSRRSRTAAAGERGGPAGALAK